MLANLKKKSSGFTIIEVLIVLAIAGLIILIVFLAIPALQRNARNTERRSDVGRIGAAVQEVITNNNGSVAAVTSPNVQGAMGTLAFYTPAANVTAAPGVAAITNGATVDTVQVHTGAICANFAAGGGRGATTTGATARSIAITFMVEPAGTASRVCQDI